MIKKLPPSIDRIFLIIILVLCSNNYTYATPRKEIKISHYSSRHNSTDDKRSIIDAPQNSKNNKATLKWEVFL